MRNDVTRDVVLDLLPLVRAGEASKDSRRLVETWSERDPTLLETMRRADRLVFDGEPPSAMNLESEMVLLQKVRRQIFLEKLFLVLAVAMTILFGAFGIRDGEVYWLWQDAPYFGFPAFVFATVFWIAYANVRFRLQGGG